MKTRTSLYLQTGKAFFAAAAGVACYLTAEAMQTGPVAGCAGEGGCNTVLQSAWSRLFGLPVSFFGLLAYGGMLWLSRPFVNRSRCYAGGLAAGLFLTIVTAAIGFSAVQVFALREICGWCISAHAAALCGAGFLWLAARNRQPESIETDDLSARRYLAVTACTVACSGAIVAAGMAVNPKAASQTVMANAEAAPKAGREAGTVALHGGKFEFRLADVPALGTPRPADCAVLIGDYTCPHCRDLHKLLTAQPPECGVIILPGYRSPEGRAIQELMLTLYHADRSAWQTVSEKLLNAELPPEREAVIAAIEPMVPHSRMSDARRNLGVGLDALLNNTRALIEANRAHVPAGNLPQLMAGGNILVGAATSPELAVFFSRPASLPSPAMAAAPAHPLPSSIIATSPVVSLGKVSPGAKMPVSVSLTNRGKTPQRLGWIDLPAGCSVQDPPHSELKPGEATLVKLLIETPTTGGAFGRQINFSTGPASPPVSVVVQGQTTLSPGKQPQ